MGKRRKAVDRSARSRPATPNPGPGDRTVTQTILVALLFTAIGLLTYSNSFGTSFHYDDNRAILKNPNILKLWPPWKPLQYQRNTTTTGRPILSLSLALNYEISEFGVWSYHVFNLTVHILSALVLFGIVRRTLQTQRLKKRFEGSALALALTISLLWLAHPIQTESVTYIIQRAESLAGLFYLSTLYCSIRGIESAKPRFWFIAAALLCVLGMGTKEVVVSAPLIVWLYDRTFLSGSLRGALNRSPNLYGGLASSWFVLAGLVATHFPSEAVRFDYSDVTSFGYAITQPEIFIHYLRLCFWPSDLCFHYNWPIAKSIGQILPFLLVVAFFLGITVWGIFRRSPLSFLGAWFFAVLAPSSSVLPLVTEVAAEHRMYLPLASVISAVVIGVFLLVSFAPERISNPVSHRSFGIKCASGLACLVLLLFAYRTYERNADYRDDLTLWRDTVSKQRSNPVAHVSLGFALLGKGATDEALDNYLKAIRLRPSYGKALEGAAMCLLNKGRPEEAVPYLQKAILTRPDDENTYYNLAYALTRLGRTDASIPLLENSVRINPNAVYAQSDLADAYATLGRTDLAIARYHMVLRIQPEHFEAHSKLGNIFLGRGEFAQALEEYAKAARIRPQEPASHSNLAAAYYALGHYAKAWDEIHLCRKLDGQPPERLLMLLAARMPEPR